jgi:hypothetical protein
MRQKLAAIVLSLAIILAGASTAYAHSGGTDASGGHADNQNVSGLGSYHYHHGEGPHLHPDGICPLVSAANAEPATAATVATIPAATTPAVTAAVVSESPTVYKINVTQASVYETASDQSAVLTTAPKDYAFTPTGVTKSYWQFTFWLGEDEDTLYTGYVRKSDCAVVTL